MAIIEKGLEAIGVPRQAAQVGEVLLIGATLITVLPIVLDMFKSSPQASPKVAPAMTPAQQAAFTAAWGAGTIGPEGTISPSNITSTIATQSAPKSSGFQIDPSLLAKYGSDLSSPTKTPFSDAMTAIQAANVSGDSTPLNPAESNGWISVTHDATGNPVYTDAAGNIAIGRGASAIIYNSSGDVIGGNA